MLLLIWTALSPRPRLRASTYLFNHKSSAGGALPWCNSPVATSPRFMPRKNEVQMGLLCSADQLYIRGRSRLGHSGTSQNPVQPLAGRLVGASGPRGAERAARFAKIY